MRTRGLEQLGPGPYIFAPNHQSHFDIAALLGLLPGVTRFAAKREMFDEPILGAVLRTMGMIPVDRDDPLSTIDRLRRVTLDGGSLVIFPPDDTASNLDPGNTSTPGFPQFGHGSIRLTALFNNPSKIE